MALPLLSSLHPNKHVNPNVQEDTYGLKIEYFLSKSSVTIVTKKKLRYNILLLNLSDPLCKYLNF